MEKAITPQFYSALVSAYPILTKNKGYALLMGHILFSTFTCESTNKPVVPAKFLAKIEGKAYTHSYLARAFLDAFSAECMHIEYSTWKWTNASARTIVSYSLDRNLTELYIAELRMAKKEKCVLLSTGEIVTPKVKQCVNERLIAEATDILKVSTNADACAIASYLNNLPQNSFTDLTKNIACSMCEAQKLSDESRQYNINLLNDIVNLVHKPVYAPSQKGNTVRLFPINSSLSQLTKSVRRAYLKGCTEIDICHAHFSINSTLWNMPIVQEYLATVGDIWQDLVCWVRGEHDFENVKSELKTTIYAIFYGANLATVRKIANNRLTAYGIKNGGTRLFKHCIVQCVVGAREAQLSAIERAGGANDCYNRFIAISDSVDSKSVLAQQAQAIELKIMRKVIELAESTTDFKVVCWLHDGVTVKFCNDEAKIKYTKKIINAIENHSAQIGFPVKVDAKDL